MKNTFTHITVCSLLALTLAGCSKTELRENQEVYKPAKTKTASSGSPGQTAQSVMSLLDFGFPYLKNGVLVVDLDLTLASESVTVNKQYPVHGRYSFNLVDNKGKSLIQNLQYSYDGGPWTPLPYTIVSGCSDPASVSSTFYEAYQSFGTAQSYLNNFGDIGSLLASDDAPNNNDVCKNADIARAFLTVPVQSGPDHEIYVKGVINGNEAIGYLGFTYDTF